MEAECRRGLVCRGRRRGVEDHGRRRHPGPARSHHGGKHRKPSSADRPGTKAHINIVAGSTSQRNTAGSMRPWAPEAAHGSTPMHSARTGTWVLGLLEFGWDRSSVGPVEVWLRCPRAGRPGISVS